MSFKEKNKKTGAAPEDDSSMSELKRRFKANPFVFVGTVIVLVIVIIAFVLVPAIVPSAGTLDSNKLTFGYYDGVPLIYNGNNYFAQARQYYSDAQNRRIFNMDEYTIWQQAFRAYLIRTAKLAAMRAAGYEPPPTLVNERTAKLPQFADENGKFSRALYNRLDASSRISLLEEVKNDTILERYDGDLSSALMSSKEKAFVGKMATGQRSFSLAALPYSAYPDSEIKTFVQKNADLFVSLHLSQISVPKEADAKKILETVQSGASAFEDAARNQSKDEFAERGGDAGARLDYELKSLVSADEDRAALRALAKGSLSGLVKTTNGWTIFRAEEDSKPADVEDSALLSRARTYIDTYERGMLEDFLLAQARELADAANGGGGVDAVGFESLAQTAGFTVSGFGPLPLNYGDSRLFSTLSSFGVPAFQSVGNKPDSGAAYDENFWKTAFGTAPAKVSKPVVLNGIQSYITLIFPKDEPADDSAAQENTESMFTGSWIEEAGYKNVEDTVLSSSKFEDQFDSVFQYLYPNEFYQHSFSSFNF